MLGARPTGEEQDRPRDQRQAAAESRRDGHRPLRRRLALLGKRNRSQHGTRQHGHEEDTALSLRLAGEEHAQPLRREGADLLRSRRDSGGCRLTQRGAECIREVGKRKGLHEVRSRLELERLLLGRKDAGEDDRPAELAQAPREGKPMSVARLDHGRVDVRRAGSIQLRDHGLVPGTSDDVLEERTDVRMRLDDQDARHGRNIPRRRRYPVTLPV